MFKEKKTSKMLFSKNKPLVFKRKNKPWKVLVVDDEEDIHSVTRLCLKSYQFKDKAVEITSAYSAKQAKEILLVEPDIGVVLLDVVMETHNAGLDLVRWIREDSGNQSTRIVLRTGQPGDAPESEIIQKYDINDYKYKTELTTEKLSTVVPASLRAYENIAALEQTKMGLEKTISAAKNIFEFDSFERFIEGTLDQLCSLLYVSGGAAYSFKSAAAVQEPHGAWIIGATTEKYSQYLGKPITSLLPMYNPDDQFGNTVEYETEHDTKLVFSVKIGESDRSMLILGSDLPITTADRVILENFVSNITNAYENIHLLKQTELIQKEIAYRLGEMVETRSKSTGGHVKRVAEMSYRIALHYGVEPLDAKKIKIASPLHDVGKIGIPDSILNKPGKLDAQEWEIMKTHAAIGRTILEGSDLDVINVASAIAGSHHERWDGDGYPDGLKGENIPIAARITAIVDVFDALASVRCYKDAWPLDRVVSTIREGRGSQFEPRLVDVMLEHFDEMIEIRDRFPDAP